MTPYTLASGAKVLDDDLRRAGPGLCAVFPWRRRPCLGSTAMDKTSYDSADGSNKLDFSYQSDNWGTVFIPSPASTQGHGLSCTSCSPIRRSLHSTRTLSMGPPAKQFRESRRSAAPPASYTCHTRRCARQHALPKRRPPARDRPHRRSSRRQSRRLRPLSAHRQWFSTPRNAQCRFEFPLVGSELCRLRFFNRILRTR